MAYSLEFELDFTNVVKKYLGKIGRPYVSIKFESVDGKELAVIRVKKSPRPVYVKYKDKTEFELYLSVGWPENRMHACMLTRLERLSLF